MIELQFFDSDAINAMTTVLSLRPDKMVIFYDPADVTKESIHRMIRTIVRHCPQMAITLITVDRLDIVGVENAFRETVEKLDRTEEIYCDITGGTEVMTACFLKCCRAYDLVPVCAKLSEGKIFNLNTGEAIEKIGALDLEEYLSAIGAEEQRGSRIVPKEADHDRILKTAEYVFDHVDTWYGLYGSLSRQVKRFGAKNAGKSYREFLFPRSEDVTYEGRRYHGAGKMLDVFREQGFLVEKEGMLAFPDEMSRDCLTTFGIWLELYVYILSKQYFDRSYLGFRIDWDDGDNESTIDNEIDVVAIKDSVPYFISCKMKTGSKVPSLSEMYEVAYLAYRFGGDNAKGIVATNATFEGMDTARTNSLYQRFKKLKVGRIEVNDLRSMPVREVFERALEMTRRRPSSN